MLTRGIYSPIRRTEEIAAVPEGPPYPYIFQRNAVTSVYRELVE
jgi:hypothetical protein